MKKLLVAVVLMMLGGVAWRAVMRDAPEPKLLFGRFWVDHEPRDDKDKFQAVYVDGDHPFGHFAARTVWTAQLEFFHYHVIPREDGVIDLLFGNTRERQRVRYVARRCGDNGFDFCLDITGSSRGVKRYYSKKEWQARAGESVDQLFDRALAR
ncbi:MAG: hypothetical protein JWM53_1278 [bacterium]|nr:hypothetical protein [bacterium]